MSDMTVDKLQEMTERHNRLVDYVRRMRGFQNEYHRYHASSDLEKAKYWQRQVDNLIKQEIKSKESNQKELF
jgi:hypothetical protein